MLFACKLVHAGHNANMWWVGLDRQREPMRPSEPRWPRVYMRSLALGEPHHKKPRGWLAAGRGWRALAGAVSARHVSNAIERRLFPE